MVKRAFPVFKIAICTAALIAAVTAGSQRTPGKSIDTKPTLEKQLLALTRGLLDAIATGDKAIWRTSLADDCLIIGEDGRTLTKSQFLDELRPLPAGYSGAISVMNPFSSKTSEMCLSL